jgi:phosphohistidine swiveling domain-containing protein
LDSLQVISLRELSGTERHTAGSKAVSLSRLAHAGIPVPPGFFVTTSAYREHLEVNGLSGEIRDRLRELTACDLAERPSVLEVLRHRICEPPLRPELAEDIERMYLGLEAETVAVRSSATAEDLPGSSFAGQYDTYLDVKSLPQCLDAVKRCWASLWTERAFDYRERNGFDHLAVDMAVIVQELVAADAAGVMFTADPVTARGDRITVEAVKGLGEALVSGRAAPDRFVLSKRGLGFIKTSLGGDGDREPYIAEREAQLLGLYAMRAEAVFRQPLDVEWAVRDGRVYLLQARPITALGVERSWEDRQVWSNMNTGEILPDVTTPATWTVAELLVNKIFGSIFGRVGMDFGPHPIIGRVAGRVYFNLNTMAGAVRSFPGLRKMDVGEVLGGAQGGVSDSAEELKDIVIPEDDIPDLAFSLWKVLVRVPTFLAWFYSLSLEKGQIFLDDLKARLAAKREVRLSDLGDAELLLYLDFVRGALTDSDAIIGIAARGMYYFMALDRICRSWLKDYRGISANRLCAGLEGMDSAEAGFELWRLALEAHEVPELESAVLRGEPFEALREEMRGMEEGVAFLARWDRFMLQHGHHTRGELELSNPRWSEDPDSVLDILRVYLRSMDRVDPLAKLRENESVRRELTLRCYRLLRNPINRRIFNHYLVQAQHGLVMRENVKSEAVRAIALIRRVLLEIGDRLASRGILTDKEEIFFLDLDEIETVLQGADYRKVKETVTARREEYEKNKAITPPSLVFGRFDPDDFVADEVDLDAEVLTGLAVCPGVVSGPARVMLRSDSGQVQPGEIMVAPFTDPGWTPHFLTAAGIVMDMGGLLSHGSIVAREYGIPTVVNVGPATRIIKTGQIVQVDGGRGVVRILR